MKAAVLGCHHRLEEAPLAERLHPRAAGGVEVVVRQCSKRRIGPARERLGEAAMAIVEKRPAQRFLKVAHGMASRNPLPACGERVASP